MLRFKLLATALTVAVLATVGTLGGTPATGGPQTAEAAGKWGFHALVWTKTIADPIGAYRIYYYKKCDPKPGKRYLRMKTNWIYRTYECWAILA